MLLHKATVPMSRLVLDRRRGWCRCVGGVYVLVIVVWPPGARTPSDQDAHVNPGPLARAVLLDDSRPARLLVIIATARNSYVRGVVPLLVPGPSVFLCIVGILPSSSLPR